MTRKILALLLACMMLLSLAACGSKEEAPAEAEGSRVVISVSVEPETLDPCQGWGHGTTPLIQSSLVEYRQDMTFANDLATDYSLSEDGLVWTFHLRDDVKFSDGEPLTASDVVFTFETAKNSQTSLDLTFLEKTEAPDDTTVVFTLKKPTSSFLNTLATIGIVPEHAYGPDYGLAPIGSGPFLFVQWNRQEQLILQANPNYYRERPAIDEVVLVFQSEDAAFAAVKAGKVDVALTAASLADTQIAGYNLQAISTVDNRGITMPMTPAEGKVTESGYAIGNDVTSNLEIRQAMAYSVDRTMLAEAAANGYATPCYSVNDGFPWNNPEVVIETNVDYAKQLLADNGWADTDGDGIVEKNGVKAQFNCMYPSGDSVRQAVAMAAAQQWKEIGILMTVEGTSWDDISKRMFSEAVCMGWGSSNPYESYCLFHSAGMLRDDYYNPEGYGNDVVDGYLDAAMQALTVEEANRYWQLSQWDGENGTAMQGGCPWVWLINVQHLYFVRDGLDIGAQQLHAHGASMALLQNLKQWRWTK